jgi:CRP-like cAMP-binding protein
MTSVSTNYLGNVLGEDPEARFAIREIPHFRKASERLLELVFRYGRIAALNAGEDLIVEGQFDQWVYFILSGQLEVLVGGVRVDRISSSMVGERCVLGEPRRATLRADKSGVAALGVDMALLDLLRRGEGGAQDAAVMLELLAVIAGEVVRRVAGLIYNEIDLTAKHELLLRSDRASGMIEALRNETFRGDRKFNLEIYKYLRRHSPRLLPGLLRDSVIEVDTHALYARCIGLGLHDLLYDLGDRLAEYLVSRGGESTGYRRLPGPTPRRAVTFPRFAAGLWSGVEGPLLGKMPALRLEFLRRVWARAFHLDNELGVNLTELCAVMHRRGGFGSREMMDLLLAVIRGASLQTARINAGLQEKLKELSQVGFAKTLAPGDEDAIAPEAYRTRSIEELVPVIGRQIIRARLVTPYRDALARRSGPAEAVHAASTDALIDSLFG